MQPTPQQIEDYRRSGYLFLRGLLSKDEVAALRAVVPELMARPGPEIKRMPDGSARLVYAPHAYSDPYITLSRLPRILGTVRALLDDEAYVYQSRINLKLPFAG
ncbi:MAG: phytanoyl-CoA dioxygenase family protein, partial [Alphaproteobacteria bacterium]